jgi:Na+-driven multidrug efflux pump
MGLFIMRLQRHLPAFISVFTRQWNAGAYGLVLSNTCLRIPADQAPLLYSIFRGLQNTHWAMIASISGVVNVGLDYLRVVYCVDGGFDGYASLTAQLPSNTSIKATPFASWTTSGVHFWNEHIKLTANFFLAHAGDQHLYLYLSYRYANSYGVEEAATHAILMNIWLFFSFFYDGFANAGNAIGGKLLRWGSGSF